MPTRPAASAPQRMASGSGRPARAAADGDIGAAHDELAMGEVDDAHHAEDDRQPARGQHQEGEGVAAW